MATQIIARSLPKTLTLTCLLSRSLSTTCSASISAVSRSSLSSPSFLHRFRPLAAVAAEFRVFSPYASVRTFATRASTSSLNDQNPNWSNRPPKETILLDGCDFEHWLVVMEKPEGEPTRDDIINKYIKTLAMVVGSEDEARMKIYSVSTRCYYAFGALVSEELSYKLKDLPGVRWVLPDSYLDVRNKDYGGEPFINGQAVPYDPKYHEEWIRNNNKANERNRRNDRPRNNDRSRNFERRRENIVNRDMQNRPPMPNQTVQNSGSNMGGVPPYSGPGGVPPYSGQVEFLPTVVQVEVPPNNLGGVPPNSGYGGTAANSNYSVPHNNAYGAPNNYGGAQPTNSYGRAPPNNAYGGVPPNNAHGAVPPDNAYGGVPPNQNMGGVPPNQNMGGVPPNQNMGGAPPNGGWSGSIPNTDYQQGHSPNRDMGGTAGGYPSA
ncbi:multiple organellar RNA editing factor 8, chloroplastic/mitochondrial-like [Quillaja saponaria]|uniref:Multiple organellar RNA editing factor 8, chloroplastic/mitochondrial-like n=1 Tax=Quillaja saponaria TaxID=32244 RepID=A0AAD7QHV2_QUISA|nr:multiple organellar RNA editing factor 8, chloroplastic/mitochondrial-like [Quillaja saponaria]